MTDSDRLAKLRSPAYLQECLHENIEMWLEDQYRDDDGGANAEAVAWNKKVRALDDQWRGDSFENRTPAALATASIAKAVEKVCDELMAYLKDKP